MSTKPRIGGWPDHGRLVHPLASGRVFPNFADPELEDWGSAYYGPNYQRLVQVKARYDPAGFFRFHQSLPVR